MQRRTLVTTVILAILIFFTSAVAFAASRNFGTHLRGENEVPVRVTNAQGEARFKLNKDEQTLHFKLNIANIENVWMAHLHLGAPGSNGPIVVWLYPRQAPPPSQSLPGRTQGTLAEGDLTAADLVGPLAGQPLSALLDAVAAGQVYVNVHTNDFVNPPNTGPGDFPGGEIRGQLEHEH
jgi:hypothetical protein